jgi:hypothetical protein
MDVRQILERLERMGLAATAGGNVEDARTLADAIVRLEAAEGTLPEKAKQIIKEVLSQGRMFIRLGDGDVSVSYGTYRDGPAIRFAPLFDGQEKPESPEIILGFSTPESAAGLISMLLPIASDTPACPVHGPPRVSVHTVAPQSLDELALSVLVSYHGGEGGYIEREGQRERMAEALSIALGLPMDDKGNAH